MRTRAIGLAAMAAAALASAPAAPARAAHPAYGPVQSVADLDRIFDAIRAEAQTAPDRPALTRLYRRAGYLVTLTSSPSWRAKFGAALPALHEDAQRQFRAAVQALNRRAEAIGTDADYAERWGDR